MTDVKLYAWMVYEEVSDQWNIIGAELPGMGMTPLVTSRLHVAQSLTRLAEAHHERTAKPVRLIGFAMSELLEKLP